MSNTITPTVFYRTLNLEGLEIFYREAGPRDAPTVLLLHGVSDPSKISPDNWVIDQAYQDRPGNKEIQLSILYNAKRNLDVYADWQEYFRKQQPPTLITWGKNDGILRWRVLNSLKEIFPVQSSIF